MMVGVLVFIANFILMVIQYALLGDAAFVGLIVGCIVALFCLVGCLAIHFNKHPFLMFRLALYAGLIAVLFEIYHSGGLTGYYVHILPVLPVVCALVFGSRETLFFSAALFIGIGGLYGAEGSLPVFKLSDGTHVMATTVIIATTISLITGLIYTLVRYSETIDGKLRETIDELSHLARHDPLTKLLNRAALTEALDALNPAKDKADLYLIDLDNFKQINDTAGHAVGDEVLTTVANTLREIASGNSLVARLGGDEFVMVVQRTGEIPSLGTLLGHQLAGALDRTCTLDGNEFKISASVGSASFPEDCSTTRELLLKADIALYQSKRCGKSRFMRYRQCKTSPNGSDASKVLSPTA